MPLCPIVGSHFHRPAKQMLEMAEGGAELWLERQPDNPYDSNAIAVYASPAIIPESQHPYMKALLAGVGLTLEELLEESSYHVGFIPRGEAAHWAEVWRQEYPDVAKLPANLSFLSSGKPAVRWEWPDEVQFRE